MTARRSQSQRAMIVPNARKDREAMQNTVRVEMLAESLVTCDSNVCFAHDDANVHLCPSLGSFMRWFALSLLLMFALEQQA